VDITQRMLAEETLIRSEKLSAAGRLAASIAHEINNPLEAVVNLIYLSKDRIESASVREMLMQADIELARVAAVSRQALGFYRDVSTATRFDIGLTVSQTVEVFSKDILKADSRPIIELPLQKTEVLGWPGEIKQVVSNLIINAIRASSLASVLRVRVRDSCNVVRIVVADQGHGIRAEHRTRIFQPFFSTKQESGTRLALWVTQQIVAKQGGRIRLRSRSETLVNGTVFVVHLPKDRARKMEMYQRYRSFT
jgi:signal transduction histidine kinase